MNAQEEAAFEQSIYHYFLFRQGQAKTAAARESESASNNSASKLSASAPTNDNNDGNQKQPAAASQESTESGTGEKGTACSAAAKPAAAPTKPPAAATMMAHSPPHQGAPGYPAPMMVPFPPGGAAMMPPLVPVPFPMQMPWQQVPQGQFGMVPVAPPGHQAIPGMTMTQAPQPSPVPTPVVNSVPPPELAAKYKRITDVILEEFPDVAKGLPPNAQYVPPEASLRYYMYPKLQKEAISLRAFKYSQLETTKTKRGRPKKVTTAPRAKKRKAGDSTKWVRIATRDDIPDDIKELIGTYKTDASNLRHKVARLESRVAVTKEKLDMSKKRAPTKPAPDDAKPAPVAFLPPVMETTAPFGPPKLPVASLHTFESRFKELEDFKRANNNTRVPVKTPGLGKWVSDLRKSYRICKEHPNALMDGVPDALLNAADLNKERLDKLDEIGFEFDVAKKGLPWQTRFEQMLEFKAKTGHCNVPRHYKEDPSLGEWVHRQRESYAKGEKVMQPGGGRREKLESVGFKWRTGTRGMRVSWEERIVQCKKFRLEHGHLNIPRPIDPTKRRKAAEKGETLSGDEGVSEDEKSFRWWAFRAREQKRFFEEGKRSTLDKKRINQLEQLGFDFETRGYFGGTGGKGGGKRDEVSYMERIEQLKRVRDIYGDCNDVKHIEKVLSAEEYKSMVSWMKNQRKMWRHWKSGNSSSLTLERRQLLEALGFNFEPRKHYAPYGTRKRGRDGDGNLDDGDASDDDSTMRDFRYIQGDIQGEYVRM